MTASEIKEALWNFYFDREETVDWALGNRLQLTKTSLSLTCCLEKMAAEEKRRSKEEAKKGKSFFFLLKGKKGIKFVLHG